MVGQLGMSTILQVKSGTEPSEDGWLGIQKILRENFGTKTGKGKDDGWCCSHSLQSARAQLKRPHTTMSDDKENIGDLINNEAKASRDLRQ